MSGTTSYRNEYAKENYDQIHLTLRKGNKSEIQSHAQAHGESTNAFINRAICEAMERDLRLDELERLAAERAAQNGVPIENTREDARIADALTVLKPIIPNIEKRYLFWKPQPNETKVATIYSNRPLRE